MPGFEPPARPADASAVAEEVASLRAAAEDRARQAELSRRPEVFARARYFVSQKSPDKIPA